MTAQLHERLILDGEETTMAFCPPLPQGHPRIVDADPAEAAAEDSVLGSTACWRGYQGTWEVRGGRLYLAGLRGKLRLRGAEPLFADWVSGVLRVPRGEMLEYVHMGFESVYEGELRLRVERGVVVERRLVDGREAPRES